jgi:hypothetical protein
MLAAILSFLSSSISETDFPRDAFMNPKNALATTSSTFAESLAGSRCHTTSVPAPHRLMALGAFAGSDPNSTCSNSCLGWSFEIPRRM